MVKKNMINNIIDDYLNITGRPAATLTVSEYLQFLNASKENLINNINSNNSVSYNHVSKPDTPANIEMPRNCSNITTEEISTETSKSNALAFLKSISG